VKAQNIPYTPNFVAQTESSQQVNIVARVSGFLDKIAYREGELVREGQVLFQLDPRPFQAQLESARANCRRTRRASPPRRRAWAGQAAGATERAFAGGSGPCTGEFDAAKAAVFRPRRK